MQVLMIFLYILLFIVCLSSLIIVHEAGHLSAAKVFRVYCLEFSIGFGPAIFKRRKEGKETQFSLRAIPFGGYVSMYGEGVELPEGTIVDNTRSLNGVKKWKRAIILVAGVFMNAVFALTLFFGAEAFIPQNKFSPYEFTVEQNSIAETIGLTENDIIWVDDVADNVFVIDYNAKIFKDYIEDNGDITVQEVKSFAIFNTSSLTFKNLSWEKYIEFYPEQFDESGNPSFNASNKFDLSVVKYASFDLPICKNSEYTVNADGNKVPTITNVKVDNYKGEKLGVSFLHLRIKSKNPLKATFKDFGDSSVAIVRGLGMMFKRENWSQMGGIVAIGFETTNTLTNYGLYYFIYIWGMISVNLAIINLIPFPGLDGWQLLVLIVEAIAHKTIPEKVKNIVSFVGIALLFGLMAVILFKDVFKYVFLVLL